MGGMCHVTDLSHIVTLSHCHTTACHFCMTDHCHFLFCPMRRMRLNEIFLVHQWMCQKTSLGGFGGVVSTLALAICSHQMNLQKGTFDALSSLCQSCAAQHREQKHAKAFSKNRLCSHSIFQVLGTNQVFQIGHFPLVFRRGHNYCSRLLMCHRPKTPNWT